MRQKFKSCFSVTYVYPEELEMIFFPFLLDLFFTLTAEYSVRFIPGSLDQVGWDHGG